MSLLRVVQRIVLEFASFLCNELQIETALLCMLHSGNIKAVEGLGRLGACIFEIWLLHNARSSEYLLTTLMPTEHVCIRGQILELPLKYCGSPKFQFS